MSNKPKRPALPPATEVGESMVYPFIEKEYRGGIAALKNITADVIDDLLHEQLNNLGPQNHKWLLAMLNNYFTQNKIPTIWRASKSISILKPGKDTAMSNSYRLISLLWSHVQTIRTLDPIQNIAYH